MLCGLLRVQVMPCMSSASVKRPRMSSDRLEKWFLARVNFALRYMGPLPLSACAGGAHCAGGRSRAARRGLWVLRCRLGRSGAQPIDDVGQVLEAGGGRHVGGHAPAGLAAVRLIEYRGNVAAQGAGCGSVTPDAPP